LFKALLKSLSTRSCLACSWAIRGDLALREGRLDSAYRFFEKAIRASPNAEAWRRMGVLMGICGQYPEAIKCLGKAVSLGDGEARRLMGYNLFRLRRYEEALACFEGLIQTTPEDGLAWYWRGLTLMETGRRAEAEESLNRSCRD